MIENEQDVSLIERGHLAMVGMIVAVVGLGLLIYCCSKITTEATEKAMRRQYDNWNE